MTNDPKLIAEMLNELLNRLSNVSKLNEKED